MTLGYSDTFLEALADAPDSVQKAFYKQSRFLLVNLQHPSLHAKKYDERRGIWQARVNRSWRFYFLIQGDTYYLIDIIPHPK
jgi:hypothetical protein